MHRALDDQEETRPVRITMEDVLHEIIAGAGVAIGVIINKGRGRIGSRLRAEAAYVGREVGGIGLTEAAKYLGHDLTAMSLAVKRLEEELQRDIKQRNQLEAFCARLRQGRRRKYQISKA